ncbi:MAG TPA: hypothetical protein PKA58_29640, partial [Polyangium sp.]|nr:hypothetical protein [Polyangium sp.]
VCHHPWPRQPDSGAMGGEGGSPISPNTSSGSSLRNDSACAMAPGSESNRSSIWPAMAALMFIAATRRKRASRD